MMKSATLARGASAGALAALLIGAALVAGTQTAAPRFYTDDPLLRVPESGDASAANPHEVGLFYSLSYNLFVTGRKSPVLVQAGNLNTIDEVPDSSWFTNRAGARQLSTDEFARGPNVGNPPAPERWTVIREKSAGFAPGFTARGAAGQTWFISFDPPSNPEGATGAMVVATKIFWALGYNQIETYLTTLRPEQVEIDPNATVRRPSGDRTPFTRDDLAAILERTARSPDGSYRVAAGRLLTGKVLGGFDYEGTRTDDPNDLVPHEHRRELRALRVFGAWTNLTDMKAGNTLDTLITENGRGIIKHYLQDVGSTFGMGANGPHDWEEGWEYLYEGGPTRKRLVTFGFALSPWQTAEYREHDAIGRFEGESFDPVTWKPRVPTAAFINVRADDAFWAARRVMAFSDEAIRAIVATGQFSDPAAAKHLGDVLIERRDKIGRAYLLAVNPIVDPALEAAGVLRFGNAAVQYGLDQAPASYTAAWFAFDNTTGASKPLGESKGTAAGIQAPAGLPAAAGAFIKVALSADGAAHAAWARPIHAYFRREVAGWKLVGFDRLPEQL
jgi:hypothetical protein